MIKRILVCGGLGLSTLVAQSTTPPKPAAAKAKPTGATSGKAFVPPKTPWGEPDLQGIWPLEHLISVGLTRRAQLGDKANLTDEEVKAAQANLDKRNAAAPGAIPVADISKRAIRQTSLIVDPPNGQFPA